MIMFGQIGSRALADGTLYRVRIGHAWLIKPRIATEARSMYDFEEKPTFIYVGTQAGMKSVTKRLKEDTVGGKMPAVRKVA